MANAEQEKYIKEIANKLNNSKVKEIQDRLITKEDIETLDDYEYIVTTHEKGFDISIRRKFILETVLNIPVLMFSAKDEYVVADELMGQHGVVWTAEQCAEYANGLLGYYDDEDFLE